MTPRERFRSRNAACVHARVHTCVSRPILSYSILSCPVSRSIPRTVPYGMPRGASITRARARGGGPPSGGSRRSRRPRGVEARGELSMKRWVPHAGSFHWWARCEPITVNPAGPFVRSFVSYTHSLRQRAEGPLYPDCSIKVFTFFSHFSLSLAHFARIYVRFLSSVLHRSAEGA